jgi:peptidoglycan LD-endopeptidase CwlK
LQNGTTTWDTKVDVNDDQLFDYIQVGRLGESVGLEWGGNWKYVDIPHFQKTFGLSINDLRSGKRPKG